jgi:hypothetical protein
MVYGNQNVRMGKKQSVNADEGTASFFKNGAEGKRLRALVLSKGRFLCGLQVEQHQGQHHVAEVRVQQASECRRFE